MYSNLVSDHPCHSGQAIGTAYKLYRQTFVSQELVDDSEDYEREYTSLRFEAGINNITNDTIEDTIEDWDQYNFDLLWYVTETSKGKPLILGSFGYIPFRAIESTFILFFQDDDSIKYCYKNASHGLCPQLRPRRMYFLTIYTILKIM